MRNPTMSKSAKVESEEHAALIHELENAWKSLQKSRPRKCLEIPTPASHHLFQASPRTLMSSLHHKKPRLLRLNNCSDAVEEILLDRRAAICSGRFKGRQLFGAPDCMMNCHGGRGELPVPEEERGRRKENGGGGCFLLATACLAVLLFVIALAFFSVSCNAKYVEEFILVPT